METYDAEKAVRVWQRVQSRPETMPTVPGLQALINDEGEAAATYLQLSRRFQGRESAMLRKMAEEELSHQACLRGIYTLATGTRPKSTRAVTPRDDTESILRRSYAGELRSVAEYEKRSADPEYGMVFAQLAREEQAHAKAVLELLGKLKNH